VNTGAFLFGGPVLHDALFAPVVAGVGVLLARTVPASWRGTLAAGLTATGVLALISVLLLWRPHAAPPNPGRPDRPYLTGLLVFVAALWLALLAGRLLRSRSPARPGAVIGRVGPVAGRAHQDRRQETGPGPNDR
jgi:peptidoglycan/LPS O-acetylase OafA/YrhL